MVEVHVFTLLFSLCLVVNIGIGISLLLQGNITLIVYILLVALYLINQIGIFVATTACAYRYGSGEGKLITIIIT